MEEATADFSYIRWLGDRREFPEGHTHLKKERDEDLRWWAELVGALPRRGKDRLRLRQQPLPEPLALDAGAVPGDPARQALMAVPVIFSTGSLYPFGLERVFGWAAEAGFDGVEIMMDDRWDTHQDAYLRDLVERHGLPSWRCTRRSTAAPGDSGRRRPWCAVAQAGAEDGRPRGRGPPAAAGQPARALDGGTLREAREQGVTVAVENMPRERGRRFLRGPAREAATCPSTSADVGRRHARHQPRRGEQGGPAAGALGARRAAPPRPPLRLEPRGRQATSTGFPARGVCRSSLFWPRWAPSGYPGAVSLELKPWPLGTPDPGSILERMRAALAVRAEGLEGVTGASRRGGEPPDKLSRRIGAGGMESFERRTIGESWRGCSWTTPWRLARGTRWWSSARSGPSP